MYSRPSGSTKIDPWPYSMTVGSATLAQARMMARWSRSRSSSEEVFGTTSMAHWNYSFRWSQATNQAKAIGTQLGVPIRPLPH